MPNRKGGTHASPDDVKKFYDMLDRGFSVTRAAEKLGFSRNWGNNWAAKRRQQLSVERAEGEAPPPLTYDQLQPLVQECLKDFLLFRKTFLARDEVPWAKDAAERLVEMVLNRQSMDRVIINTPPGVGKTTLFTFDIPAWLICGGGSLDPAFGRALRIMLGHEASDTAEDYVNQLREFFTITEPWEYQDQQTLEIRRAELVPQMAFGRFKPNRQLGEDGLWRRNKFNVATIGGQRYQKEPTVQAASYEGGFIGQRVDYAMWDDIVTFANSVSPERTNKLERWWANQAEARVEKSYGTVGIVGQRLSAGDLFRRRLDKTFENDDGEQEALYQHIVYPAHNDATCTADDGGEHEQWDANDHGCLLDAKRLPWQAIKRVMTEEDYLTVYQQQDSNPYDVLVRKVWLDGGEDPVTHETSPGCWDRQRGFWEWPEGWSVTYAVVDPSVNNFWAVEVWAVSPANMHRSLIWGTRKRLNPGTNEGFLDWDQEQQKHVGLIEELQTKTGQMGHPIVCWVIESVSTFKWLFRTNAYHTWQKAWPLVQVIPHETQKSKSDAELGVWALLPQAYKTGAKRLPGKHGDIEALNYVHKHKVKELLAYPNAQTDDTVMADWFGEYRIEEIVRMGKRFSEAFAHKPDPRIPAYLRKRRNVYVYG